MTYGKAFWLDTMERCIRTAGQSMLAAWAATKVSNIYDIDFKAAIGVGAFGFLITLVTCVVAAPIGKDNSASFVPKLILWLLCPLGLLVSLGGCTSTPNQVAAEMRSLYKEAQFQADKICADPNVDHTKCEEKRKELAELEKSVDKIELVAASLPDQPIKNLDWLGLTINEIPTIRHLLIRIIVMKYLGA